MLCSICLKGQIRELGMTSHRLNHDLLEHIRRPRPPPLYTISKTKCRFLEQLVPLSWTGVLLVKSNQSPSYPFSQLNPGGDFCFGQALCHMVVSQTESKPTLSLDSSLTILFNLVLGLICVWENHKLIHKHTRVNQRCVISYTGDEEA